MAVFNVVPARQNGEGGGGGGGVDGNFKHTWRTFMNKVQLNTAQWAYGRWDVHQFDHC